MTCSKELGSEHCNNQNVRTVELKTTGRIVLLCAGCRKAHPGEYRLMHEPLNKIGYMGGQSYPRLCK